MVLQQGIEDFFSMFETLDGTVYRVCNPCDTSDTMENWFVLVCSQTPVSKRIDAIGGENVYKYKQRSSIKVNQRLCLMFIETFVEVGWIDKNNISNVFNVFQSHVPCCLQQASIHSFYSQTFQGKTLGCQWLYMFVVFSSFLSI